MDFFVLGSSRSESRKSRLTPWYGWLCVIRAWAVWWGVAVMGTAKDGWWQAVMVNNVTVWYVLPAKNL